MSSIRPVVLCGGAGSRLWPASRPDRPKPLLPLVSERSLLAETVDRFAPLGPPWIVCGRSHADAVRATVPGLRILVEDVPRGTGAAVALAATEADPDDVLLVVPADHAVADPAALRDAVRRAVPSAVDDWIVTFGVVPTAPATGYGWIAPGDALGDGVFRIARFLEKPDRPTAERLLADGRSLWNAGLFLFRAGAMREALARHAPDLLADGTGSIDVRLMERTDRAAVVPVACGWSDVGTWSAVAAARDGAPVGPATIEGSPGTFVWSDGPSVAVLDAPGLVVVASGGGVLVASPAAADRCGALPSPGTVVLDRGVGWEVRRLRLDPGTVEIADLAVVVSGRIGGRGPGEVLPPGTWTAEIPSVVVIVGCSRVPEGAG